MSQDFQDQWAAVDEYLTDLLFPSDPILEAALKDSDAAGLPAISVTQTQGKILWLFARLVGARNFLGLGTLGGLYTIWLSRALPIDGSLNSIESNHELSDVACAILILK